MFRPSYGPAFTLIGAKISCLKLLFSGGKRQKGVYSSKLFYKDGQNDPMESVHVILLDARSGRDPTYFTYGKCQGANSRMLIDEQWDWLDKGCLKTL